MARKKVKPLIILTILTGFIIFCILLLSQYFQQDEWHSFGLIQSYGARYLTFDRPFWQLFFTDRIAARSIMFLFFKIFEGSSLPFALLAIFTHTINTILVGYLAFKLTKNRIISFLSSIFFFTNSVGHQAYSWFGTLAGSSTNITFILISVIFYFIFIEKRKYIYLFLSLFFIWVSFLFKESGYFVFILYPIAWILYSNKKSLKKFALQNLPVFIYGFYVTVILAVNIVSLPSQRANYVASDTSGVLNLFRNATFYPLEGISQVFLPSQPVFATARIIAEKMFLSVKPETWEFDLFYTTTIAEGVSVALSLLFILLFFYAFKKYISKNRDLKLFFIFSFLLLSLSFLPYVVLDKFDAYLDSRYYYAAMIGASFIFGILSLIFIQNAKSNLKKSMVLGAMLVLIFSHLFFLVNDLLTQAEIARERKNIISQILTLVPKIDKKTVFYVTGNSPGYYGIPELKVPFQSGLGQMLLVEYGIKKQVSPDIFAEGFIKQGFLFDTLAQGYKEVGGQGFGYFYDKQNLEESMGKGQFDQADIISLFYDSDSKKIFYK
ncbi:MAG: hypothetical protein Q7K55_05535 [Candidatus Levybacteria bacterium]|nr:hypothetical protein [Candidatus Levybacteria bacterium]